MINRIFSLLITGLRPLFGPATCYYAESCTPFALRQLQEKTFSAALLLIAKRILSCNPLIIHYTKLRYYLLLGCFVLGVNAKNPRLTKTADLAHQLVASSYHNQAPIVRHIWVTLSGCNAEIIRDSVNITAFFKHLAKLFYLYLSYEPQIQYSQNGYVATLTLENGSIISLVIDNNQNRVYLSLVLTPGMNEREIIQLSKVHFQAAKAGIIK